MEALEALALSKKYTEETVIGGGAIKGKNCTIDKMEDVENGKKITFKWTLDDGTIKTGSLILLNGAKGDPGTDGAPGAEGAPGVPGMDGVGIDDITSEGNVMTIVLSNNTQKKIAIPTIGVDEVSDLKDIELDMETLATGQILSYDAVTQKWKNVPNSGGGGGDASLAVDVTSNVAVGAIPSGTKLSAGTTFTEFAQKLLVTEVAPTINFSLSKGGNVPYGGSYIETLTVAVTTLGSAKAIDTIAWYQGNTLLQTDIINSTVPGSWTYTLGAATTDTTTFKAVVTYKKSNNTQTTMTKTASINFYYNKFYGAVADLNPDEATVEALTSVLATGKGGTYSFTVSAGRICYAYPKSLGALSSIKDGNGFSLFDSFTRTEQNYTQNNTTVAYYRYVLTDATTVSGYSVIFN